jgi:hypothetical protein
MITKRQLRIDLGYAKESLAREMGYSTSHYAQMDLINKNIETAEEVIEELMKRLYVRQNDLEKCSPGVRYFNCRRAIQDVLSQIEEKRRVRLAKERDKRLTKCPDEL